MKIGSFAGSPVIQKAMTYLKAARAIVEPLCLRIWAILNRNLVEGVLLPDRYLVVSMERGSISVAAGERFLNRRRLKGSGRYAVEGGGFPAPDDLAAAVSRAVKELGCTGTKVLLGVPREWVVMRMAELPSTVKENIGPVVTHEIDRLTPLTAADAMYDFVVGPERDGRIAITLMAARRGMLDPFVAALTDKGFLPAKITTPSVDMARLCGYLAGTGTFVSLHVNRHGYEGWSVEGGNLAGNFYGSLDPGEEEGDPQRRYEDVRAVVTAAAAGGSHPVCLVAENGVEAADVLPGIAHRRMGDSETISLFGGSQKNVPFVPAAMLHEALSPGIKSFDLGSSGYREKRKAPLVASLILATLLVMMLIPYVVVPLEIEKRKIAAIEEQIRSRRKDVMEVERLKKEAEVLQGELDGIEDFKKKRPMSLNILKGLTSLLPKTAWLTRTRITEETAELEGYAASATGVLSLLEQSDLFRKVEFASPTMKDARLNSERFVVRMELEGFKKQQTKTEGTVKKDEKGK